MHLISFHTSGPQWQIGALRGAAFLSLTERGLPADMTDFIAWGEAGKARARALIEAAADADWRPLDTVGLGPPIPRPARNIFCVGKNYLAHVKEFTKSVVDAGRAVEVPAAPIIFTKCNNTVIGPNATIPAYLDPTGTTDYEGELAVVIGSRGRSIPRTDALRHVYGFTIINDVTSRALQRSHGQWFLGKNIDGFCPMGPSLVTADEFSLSNRPILQTFINDELRQHASVADLIFDVPTLIETLSQTMTLEAGDIIATGTPAGVGMGFEPPRFLQRGDTVRISIDGLGQLCNIVG